jgi:hypothetical protein
MPTIKEREDILCSYLITHILKVYFMLQSKPLLLAAVGSFFVHKNILMEGALTSWVGEGFGPC